MDIEAITAGPFELTLRGPKESLEIIVFGFDRVDIEAPAGPEKASCDYMPRRYYGRHRLFGATLATLHVRGGDIFGAVDQLLTVNSDPYHPDYVDMEIYCETTDQLRLALVNELFGGDDRDRTEVEADIDRVVTEVRAETAAHAIRMAANHPERNHSG